MLTCIYAPQWESKFMTITAQYLVGRCDTVHLFFVLFVAGIGMVEFAQTMKSLFYISKCGPLTQP